MKDVGREGKEEEKKELKVKNKGRGKCNRRLTKKDSDNFGSLLNKGPGPHWGKLLGGRQSRCGQWSILSKVGTTFLFLGQLSS